jgi:hypothetical protein
MDILYYYVLIAVSQPHQCLGQQTKQYGVMCLCEMLTMAQKQVKFRARYQREGSVASQSVMVPVLPGQEASGVRLPRSQPC